jgi:ABC-type nitrate/sulfonate/bicarbonate transport system permease component
MYFGVLAITVLGLLSNWALVSLERRFTRWKVVPGGR